MDFFAHLREQPADGLFISKPFTGRITGRAVISFSRRMIGPDGRFAGAVSVGLDPAYFLQTYKSFDLGQRGLIQLVGLDGVVRARRVGYEDSFGDDMRESQLLTLAAKTLSGHFHSSGGRSDGLPRYQSYRAVRGYPLVVSVGTTEIEVFGQFEPRRRTYLLSAVAGTFGVLLFAAGLLFQQQRRAKAEVEKRAMESRYRATFDHAGVGIAHLSLDGRYISVNPKFCAMLGYSAEELLCRASADVTHPDDVEPTSAVLRELLTERKPGPSHDLEKRYLRKDGSLLWGVITLVLVRTEDGSPGYFISMVRDITLRKQQEQRLLEQLDELRRFQKVTVERELRMIELEAEIRAVRGKAAA
jgi:PAS domain S-box-containing protein